MADPTHFYSGWLLDPAEREALLARFPPHYPVVVAHHVTLKFGDAAAAPQPASGEIVGEADDGTGVQALVAAIDGGIARPDGGTFHVTWSLAEEREARESNDVIAECGWRPVTPPVPLQLTPKPPSSSPA